MNIEGFRRMSDGRPKRVEWLWDARIPLGEITILEGDPGVNKSSLAVDLAARLTRGDPMPCVSTKPRRKRRGGVIFLIGEDSLERTVRGRLEAAGAELGMVGVFEHAAVPDDLLSIAKAMHTINAKLIVVDTIQDFFNCNLLGNQAVRAALQPLRALADSTNSAVMLIRHFVKSGSGKSLMRGSGSLGITAMARSQLKVFPHPDDAHLRVVVQDKSNLAPLSPTLVFEVACDSGAVQLRWHGETALSTQDLQRGGAGRPKLEAAERFLFEKLADGPHEVGWLLQQSRGLFSKRTLDAAKRSLEIETRRRGQGTAHRVSWSLPSLRHIRVRRESA